MPRSRRRSSAITGILLPVSSDARQGIQSVEVAMKVLTALESLRRPASLSEIARAAELQPNKVHRYLVSLGRVGLVEQRRTSGFYALGPAMRRLGMEALRQVDEVNVATEYAEALRDETQHTINLTTWSDAGPVIVRWDYGAHPLPITVRPGSPVPLLDTAPGRVFLAYLPDATTNPVLREQQKRKTASHVDRQELVEMLEGIREQGYARVSEGIVPGLESIAVPIFGPGSALALVMGMIVPSSLLKRGIAASLTALLLATASSITKDLGGPTELRTPAGA